MPRRSAIAGQILSLIMRTVCARKGRISVNPKVSDEAVEKGLVGGSNLSNLVPTAKKPG
jgi:hypothetical protein